MKKHNTNSPPRLVALMKLPAIRLGYQKTIAKSLVMLTGAALLGLVSQSALAVGTASGTLISNSATLAYSVGGVAQTGIGSSLTGNTAGPGTATTFLVDNKVNLSVVGGGVTTVTPGQVGGVSTFVVTNLGNTVQDFLLTPANNTTGTVLGANTDNFDGTGLIAFVDTNTNGVLDAGEKQYIDELAPGASVTVTVLSTIPIAQVNNDISVVNLLATARAGGLVGTQGAALVNAGVNTAGVDVVFADTVAGTDDLVLNANHSDRTTYKVVTATLSVMKTVTPICDPANGDVNPKNIPGAAVRYAITIANVGSAPATLTSLSDTLDAALLIDPKLNSGAMPATSCVSGNVANTLSASGFGAVRGVGVGPGTLGVAADATTAGASIAGQVVTILYGTLASTSYGAVNASLAAGSYVTVYFNAFVQ
jgi:hypothetical protein